VTGASAELLQELFRASPDAVIVVDASGRIEIASPAVDTLFGWRPDELVGEPVEVLIPTEARGLHRRHRAAYALHPGARAMGTDLDLKGPRRDGSTFFVDVSLVPVLLGEAKLVGAFVRDSKERRRNEHLLRSVNEIRRQLLPGGPPPRRCGSPPAKPVSWWVRRPHGWRSLPSKVF
jgi:PAS domain S-box-containing protein